MNKRRGDRENFVFSRKALSYLNNFLEKLRKLVEEKAEEIAWEGKSRIVSEENVQEAVIGMGLDSFIKSRRR